MTHLALLFNECLGVKMRPVSLIFVFAAFAATACENAPCSEPQKLEELHERFDERSSEWIDEAAPYPLQLEKVAEKRATLRPFREKLVRGREADTSKMIDAFVKPTPDVATIHALVNQAQKSSMTYGWKLFELAFDLQPLFTTEQRQLISDGMSEPPDPFSTPFLARRAIDYTMFKIDADDEQKSAVAKSLSSTESKINVMLKAQHKTKMALLANWTQRNPDLPTAKAIVQKSSDDVTGFVHGLIDETTTLAQRFRPQQREFVNDRLVRMKTCPTK